MRDERYEVNHYSETEEIPLIAYAIMLDDIVLLAPRSDALRSMLKICDEYANSFNILFNAKKKSVCNCYIQS